MPKHLDPELVRKCFDYDKNTGELKRISTIEKFGQKAIGRKLHIGHGGKKYYRHGVFKSAVYEHRLIWVWMTGEQPETIDHADGDGLNNKWENLRNVKFSENAKNQKMHVTNTSGRAGVSYRKDSGKWRARITVDGKLIHLGNFDSLEGAAKARLKAASRYGFHENHGRAA